MRSDRGLLVRQDRSLDKRGGGTSPKDEVARLGAQLGFLNEKIMKNITSAFFLKWCFLICDGCS